MPFSENIIKQAWRRSGGRCECVIKTHNHTRICKKKLLEYTGKYPNLTCLKIPKNIDRIRK